jgi:hypothetical protein
MTVMPKVLDRSATKPIYLLVVEDPMEKEKVAYYKTQELTESASTFEFRGFLLTKQQADKLRKDPYEANATTSAKSEPKPVNRKIPMHRIIRIENVTYRKPQGE